jgi:hypothetical protein
VHSAVIPARFHSAAYFATHAASCPPLGRDSSTRAIPDKTTMSPPFASPRKFNATFGLLLMLRIRAPGWLYTNTFSLPSHRNPTGRGSGAPNGVTVVSHTIVSSRKCHATRAPNSLLSSIIRRS